MNESHIQERVCVYVYACVCCMCVQRKKRNDGKYRDSGGFQIS
jgi:hypothetical protein